jgi:NitT/TauT family transport system permease protein
LSKIIIPAMMPEVLTALRMTITICLAGGGGGGDDCRHVRAGLSDPGFRNALRMDYVMDGMIVIGLVGLALDYPHATAGRNSKSASLAQNVALKSH